MSERIYLDHAATTPVDSRVTEAMQPYFAQLYGNPASLHHFGREAERALTEARREVADILNCRPEEIIFTGGGTEALNLALRGATLAAAHDRNARHLVISAIEHPAVLATASQLRDYFGFALTAVPVDRHGRVAAEDIARAMRADTAIAAVMYANNEIGSIQPIAEIAAVCHEYGVPLLTDAVQAAGQLELDMQRLGADYLALGAHKFYGPKGVGVLYVRQGSPLLPMHTGGGQEHGRRAGTPNLPYIVGLAKALTIATVERETHTARFRTLRDRLIAGTLAAIPDSAITGHPLERLPNHASFVFRNVGGNELLMHLDVAGIAASAGSACKTGAQRPAAVLQALGLPPEWALGALRLTVGRQTTEAHVERALALLPGIISRLRGLTASGEAQLPARG